MIVEWVRRDDGALLRRNPRPYPTVIRPTTNTQASVFYVNDRPRGECFASFLSSIYHPTWSFSDSSFWTQNIPRSDRVSLTLWDGEQRENEKNREKEKLDSLASLYHDGTIKQGRIRVPFPSPLVPQFSSQSLWVYSRLRGISYIHTQHWRTPARALIRSVIRIHTYTHEHERMQVSVPAISTSDMHHG